GARLVPGAAYVLDALGFDARARASRAVVTGEGRLDAQTLAGKAVGEVAVRCRQNGIPCHAIVGQRAIDAFEQRLLDLATTAEAVLLARGGMRTTLQARTAAQAERLGQERVNHAYLPEVPLPRELRVESVDAGLARADYVFLAVPSRGLDEVIAGLAGAGLD